MDKDKTHHRGRIQAQGENLEESQSWAQEEPPTKTDGLNMLQKLMNKLSKKDREIRRKPCEKAKKFIENAAENGGVDATVFKSFYVKDTDKERIDIEVRQGIAFVPDENVEEKNE
ncbi:MAG: hypothetical protein JW922_10040 [Paludibacteraceae bacterium]|nr:hypothetical protein [Paludibacteraceae bacterium]